MTVPIQTGARGWGAGLGLGGVLVGLGFGGSGTGLGVTEELVEFQLDLGTMVVEDVRQGGPVGKPHGPGQPQATLGVAGEDMGLLVLPCLEAVLHQAQEAVGLGEPGDGLRGEQVQGPEALQHRQNGADLQGPSRPPRTSCRAWPMNSISRMPPGPSLMLACIPLRWSSLAIKRLSSRSDSMAP